MRKYLFFIILFSCLAIITRGQTSLNDIVDLSGLPQQTEAKGLRYWFDNDAENALNTTVLSGEAISAKNLVDGVHVVHCQVVDNKYVYSIPYSKLFIKISGDLTAKYLRYWFDSDPNTVKTTTSIPSGVTTIDASGLVEGIHTVHYQIVDNNGTAGVPVTKMFMKLGAKTVTATVIQYWFDDNDANIKESTITNLSTTVDASGLGKGKHVLHYQLKLSDGTLSPPASATFETTQTLKGDANNDHKVNVADIVVIQIFIDDNTKAIHGANADATGNGVVDEEDVEAVSDIIMGSE